MFRRGLQLVLVAVAAILFVTGTLGIVSGIDDGFYGVTITHNSGTVILDSNLRFYTGMSIGFAFVLLWLVPRIERRGDVLALLAVPIFLGGLGRVLGMARFDVPVPLFVLFAVLELIFPVLLLWQHEVAVRAGAAPRGNATAPAAPQPYVR